MQGYSPAFNIKPKSEIASKVKSSFIELGVKSTKHEDNSKCDKCINKQNT